MLLALALGPFSHKTHAPLKLECAACHGAATTGDRAGFPEATLCGSCHQQVRGNKEKVVPERSAYPLPEFVFFSHAKHGAPLVCQTCHGQVWKMDQVQQVLPMTMKACINCHYAMHAPTKCGKCHELGQ